MPSRAGSRPTLVNRLERRWRGEPILGGFRAHPAWNRAIFHCGDLDDVELRHAYRSSTALVFPSLEPLDPRVPMLLTIHDLTCLHVARREGESWQIESKRADIQRRAGPTPRRSAGGKRSVATPISTSGWRRERPGAEAAAESGPRVAAALPKTASSSYPGR